MFAGAKLDKFPGSQLLDLFTKGSSSAPNTPAHNSKVKLLSTFIAIIFTLRWC